MFLSLTWVNYFILLFWVVLFLFLINCNGLLQIILFSEIVWVILYCITVVFGVINDDLVLTTTSFFLLALAGLEFCIGFIITIYFKNFKKTFLLGNPQRNNTYQYI